MFKNLTKLTTFIFYFHKNIDPHNLVSLPSNPWTNYSDWSFTAHKPLSLSLFPVKIQWIEFETKPRNIEFS